MIARGDPNRPAHINETTPINIAVQPRPQQPDLLFMASVTEESGGQGQLAAAVNTIMNYMCVCVCVCV